jgi:hypothetical protein
MSKSKKVQSGPLRKDLSRQSAVKSTKHGDANRLSQGTFAAHKGSVQILPSSMGLLHNHTQPPSGEASRKGHKKMSILGSTQVLPKGSSKRLREEDPNHYGSKKTI